MLATGQWHTVPPYPLFSNLSQQPVIYIQSVFYIFGGHWYDNKARKEIARLDARTYEWTDVGELIYSRENHSVIFIENSFLIIGGLDNIQTEKCYMSSGTMSCSKQTLTITD